MKIFIGGVHIPALANLNMGGLFPLSCHIRAISLGTQWILGVTKRACDLPISVEAMDPLHEVIELLIRGSSVRARQGPRISAGHTPACCSYFI